jgi:Putative Actinobacterial Holin-X, holin superfamily III
MNNAVVIAADGSPSAAGLVKDAIDEARELIKLEVALARNDFESELRRVRAMAIAFAVAGVTTTAGLAMVLFVVAMASGAAVAVGVVAAIALFASAGGAAIMGYRRTSAEFFQRTRKRIGQDVQKLGEEAHEL